jgi:hypothetical protein
MHLEKNQLGVAERIYWYEKWKEEVDKTQINLSVFDVDMWM